MTVCGIKQGMKGYNTKGDRPEERKDDLIKVWDQKAVKKAAVQR